MKTNQKKDEKLTMDDLSVLKTQVKQSIDTQKEQVKYSAQHLLLSSPAKLFSAVTNIATVNSDFIFGSKKIAKGISVVNGIIIGYKIAKGISRFIKKVKI